MDKALNGNGNKTLLCLLNNMNEMALTTLKPDFYNKDDNFIVKNILTKSISTATASSFQVNNSDLQTHKRSLLFC